MAPAPRPLGGPRRLAGTSPSESESWDAGDERRLAVCKGREKTRVQTYVVLKLVLVLIIVVNLVEVVLVVEVLELECLAGKIVDRAGDDLFQRRVTSEESI